MRVPTLSLSFALLLISLLLPAFGSSAEAQNDKQQPIPVPSLDPGELGQPDFQFAGDVPTTLSLIPHGIGRPGHLWIGNTGDSIRVIGEVDGDAPQWPTDADSILAKDHVEVWLAAAADPDLPPIGWGDQFGEHSADGCLALRSPTVLHTDAEAQKMCLDWAAAQEAYRPFFKRLFLRHWLLADGISVESDAKAAYSLASSTYGSNGLTALEPRGEVRFRSQVRPGNRGYRFQVDIPYSSFPPLNSLQLSELRLMVDVFSAVRPGEQGFSTTSPNREPGQLDSFNRLRLDTVHEFMFGPCGNKLEGTDAYGNLHSAWFVPEAITPGHPYQADAFLIVNEAHGYQYEPGDTISPVVRPIHLFWRGLGSGEWVCGPMLSYRSASAIRQFNGVSIAEDGFDAMRAQDGQTLVKEGPMVWHSEFGSGQCGGCARTQLKIWTLDKNLNLITLLELGATIQEALQDFTVSPDWSRVVEFDQRDYDSPVWSSVTYCFDQNRYKQCDRQENVNPPNPPVIRQLLEQDR